MIQPREPACLERLEPRQLLTTLSAWQPLGEPGSGGRIDAITVSPYDSSRVLVGGDMLGAGRSTNGGNAWQPTIGFASWEISDFTYHPSDPNIVWAGSLSGPHRSTDGGQTWSLRSNGMPTGGWYPSAVEKVLFDESDPTSQTLLAFGGDHREFKDTADGYGKVWRSEDGGNSWWQINDLQGNIMSASFGGTTTWVVWAAVKDKGIFRSGDHAWNFTAKNTGLPTLDGNVRVTSLAAHPTNANTAYVTIGTRQGSGDLRDIGGVFRTTNAGSSWQQVLAGDTSSWNPVDFLHVDVSADGNTIWATDNNWGSSKGLWKSTDGGNNWSHVLNPNNYLSKLQGGTPFKSSDVIGGWWVEVDSRNANNVFFGSSSVIWKTTNGGNTWNDVTSTLVGGDRYKGTGFTGWVSNNIEYNPYNSSNLTAQAFDMLTAGISKDGGSSWKLQQNGLPLYGGGNDIAWASASVGYAALGQSQGSTGLVRTNDGGDTWTALNLPSNNNSPVENVHVNGSNNTQWITTNGKLYRSYNGQGAGNQVTWQQINVDGKTVRGLEAVPSRGNHFFVTTDAGVYFTNNGGGVFWSTGPDGPSGNASLAADPTDENKLWAAKDGNGGGLWFYDRYASTPWKKMSLPGGADYWSGDVAIDPTDNQHIAVITNQNPYTRVSEATGVWFSENGGTTWRKENQNLPVLRGQAITFSPDGGKLLVGTTGRGFFKATVSGSPETIGSVGSVGSVDTSRAYDLRDFGSLFSEKPLHSILNETELL